jgi:UDP:flavonoid glycosyltransferase YjiC (YdhE family)
LGIPILGDQFYNAAIVRDRGFGLVLSKDQLTDEDKIVEALGAILDPDGL